MSRLRYVEEIGEGTKEKEERSLENLLWFRRVVSQESLERRGQPSGVAYVILLTLCDAITRRILLMSSL